MFLKRVILLYGMVWYGMVCYPMLWYGKESLLCYAISMLCYDISMLCYAMVYVVKDNIAQLYVYKTLKSEQGRISFFVAQVTLKALGDLVVLFYQ